MVLSQIKGKIQPKGEKSFWNFAFKTTKIPNLDDFQDFFREGGPRGGGVPNECTQEKYGIVDKMYSMPPQ